MLPLHRAALIIFILSLAGAAQADPYVLGTYKPVAEGYLLEFTVYNPTADLINIFSIDTGDATAISSPQGWRSHQTDRHVDWSAYELPEMIGQGKKRGGFSFIASTAPNTLDWWISSARGYSGKVTPTLIPEPSSLLALAAGLSTIGGCALRRKTLKGE